MSKATPNPFDASDAASAGDLSVCPICKSGNCRLRISGSGFAILECLDCHGARTSPASYVSQSEYAASPAFSDGYLARESQFRRYARRGVRQIRRHVKGNARWLDVGSSVGFLVDEARSAGFRAQGIDLDPNAIRIGQSLGFNVSAVELSAIPNSSFEVLTLSHCLEHIQHPIGFLQCCREKLVARGTLFIVVPCHDSFLARALPSHWYGWQPAQHYFHYSRPALARLLTASGFTVRRIHQESMDHSLGRGIHLSLKSIVKNSVIFSLVCAGNLLNRGDQLVAIALRNS